MAAQLEEVVVNSHLLHLQQFRPDPGQGFLLRRSWRNIGFIVSLFLAAYILFVLIPEIVEKGASYLAALVLIFVPSLLWAYLRGSKNLHCTRESLEVIRIARGKVRERWLFPKEVVKGIRFAPVAYSRYGSKCGLVFTVQRKMVKVLSGLECPEADTILKQLDRLGFDVVQDVGMPMMVEMALERRDSPFNL